MPQATEVTELIADVREQLLYLQELGVETLDVELASLEVVSGKWKVESSGSPRPSVAPMPEINFKSEVSDQKKQRPPDSRLSSLPSLSKLTGSAPLRSAELPKSPISDQKTEALFGGIAPILPEPIETIEQIRSEIGADCSRCKLSTLGRSKVVNSVGNFNADLMFVGEAPGADEDEQGEPFVGRAGQLLTKIIEGIGLKREEVFIGNINRCRPPGNRAPEMDESVACKPFLRREIAVVRPKVIVVLGATAAQNLLETKVPIGKLRGHFHDYLGVKVMPTFHPAYLLRDPHKKREVWDDMKMVRDYLKLNS